MATRQYDPVPSRRDRDNGLAPRTVWAIALLLLAAGAFLRFYGLTVIPCRHIATSSRTRTKRGRCWKRVPTAPATFDRR